MQMELDSPRAGETGAPDATKSQAPPSHWPNRSFSRQVTVSGRQWHLQEMGRGEPLLMLHGTGASTHSFRAILPLLAERFRVMAVDLPGHGFTTRADGERLSLDCMANALRDLLNHEGFRAGYLVGHSAGAAVALRMSLDGTVAPAAIVGLNAALVPFGGAWRGLISPVTRLIAASGLTSRLIAATARDPGSLKRMISSTGSHLDEEGVALYRALFLRPAHAAAVLSMMANWDLGGLLDELPGLDAKLTLLAGGRDLAVPPAQIYRVARRCDGVEVIDVPDGGHLVHEEQPALTAALVANALRPERTRATDAPGEA